MVIILTRLRKRARLMKIHIDTRLTVPGVMNRLNRLLQLRETVPVKVQGL